MIFSLQDDCVLCHKVMLHFHDEREVQQTRKYRWCAQIVSCQSVWGGISKMFGDIEAITISNHEMIHVVCHSQQHRSRLLFFWISHTPGEEPASKKQRREEFVLICFL